MKSMICCFVCLLLIGCCGKKEEEPNALAKLEVTKVEFQTGTSERINVIFNLKDGGKRIFQMLSKEASQVEFKENTTYQIEYKKCGKIVSIEKVE